MIDLLRKAQQAIAFWMTQPPPREPTVRLFFMGHKAFSHSGTWLRIEEALYEAGAADRINAYYERRT